MRFQDFAKLADMFDFEEIVKDWKRRGVDGKYQFRLAGMLDWYAIAIFDNTENLIRFAELDAGPQSVIWYDVDAVIAQLA